MTRGKENPNFEIRRSSVHGLGAFAKRRIRKGARVAEYTGELIDDQEASRRYDEKGMRYHHTFLFGVGDGFAIDAGVGGNEARYINHSCDPSCEAVEYDDLRVFIHALRTIEPGEELSYDYAFSIEHKPTKADRAFYPCRCGSPLCRGTTLAVPPPRTKGSDAVSRRRA